MVSESFVASGYHINCSKNHYRKGVAQTISSAFRLASNARQLRHSGASFRDSEINHSNFGVTYL